MKPWLTVVGVGEDGLAGLSAAAVALVETAETLVGGERTPSGLDGAARPGEIVEDRDIARRMRQPQRQRAQ